MKTRSKLSYIVASVLIVIGCVIFVVAMSLNGWDFKKLNAFEFKTTTHQITEQFSDIQINVDVTDIKIVSTQEQSCKVTCYEQEKVFHQVKVVDNTLKIDAIDSRGLFDRLALTIGSPLVTIYLPQSQYGALKIKQDTGDVEIACPITFESVGIEVDTGDVYASKVTCNEAFTVNVDTGDCKIKELSCGKFISDGDTGDVYLEKVTASQSMAIERDTGDIKLTRCDGGEISIQTDTGDVSGSLLSEKIFIVRTDTGDINVPPSVSGGRCQITTDTGDIEIVIVAN